MTGDYNTWERSHEKDMLTGDWQEARERSPFFVQGKERAESSVQCDQH